MAKILAPFTDKPYQPHPNPSPEREGLVFPQLDDLSIMTILSPFIDLTPALVEPAPPSRGRGWGWGRRIESSPSLIENLGRGRRIKSIIPAIPLIQ